MSRLAIALLITGSSSALAQSNIMNIMVDGQNDVTHSPYALSVNDCTHIARITWTLPNGSCQNSASIFVTTAGSCPTTPGAADVQVPINADGVSGNITVSNLATFQTADAGTLTCPRQIAQQNRVCGTYQVSNGIGGGCTVTAGGFASIYWKGIPPNPPRIDNVTPLDTQITVNASTNELDVAVIHVEVAEADGGTFQERASFTPSVGSATISGLTDNVTYQVRARAEDQVPQLGPYSGIVEVTPILTQGFWDRYLSAGGAERGGCGGLGAMIFAWCLPGVVLVSLLRRKRSCGRPDKS
jgi:hypothetical protein